MFHSTIIPTIGRSTLARAVESVINQRFSEANFEIIVVNDSGKSLPAARWQESPKIQVINTKQVERSVARNTGAAVARGSYLHFLDDDDRMEDGALDHFWELSRLHPDVAWIYGGSQLIDSAGNPTTKLIHQLSGNCFIQVMAGEWIPLQASLIKADAFFQVGGFNPHITGPEDIDLLRRICYSNEIAETEKLVAWILRDDISSTTDYVKHPKQSRWAREEILELPGVFTRMRASAFNPYWQGRLVRVYVTSLVWNLTESLLFTAASRLTYLLASLFVSSPNILSKQYWQAISGPYESPTFARGVQHANDHNSV